MAQEKKCQAPFMNKADIKSLSKKELESILKDSDQPPYRARQIYRWLYKIGAKSFDEMTDLSRPLRSVLKKRFHISGITLLDSKRSLSDGTTKYLFKLEDGNTIEVVLIPRDKRNTVCLSSQVGCKFGCSFCASAPFGFVRNLAVSEILDEVIYVRENNATRPITNLVFMGIGEPLDNYDNVLAAVRILNDKDAFHIGARRITISTCGIIPGIERLKKESLQVELSVSLHSADDKVRSKLVPINKRYPLAELMKACKDYVKKTNRIITFEYVLLNGVNCSKDDAVGLARLLRGIKCKVNTISYNQIRAKGFEAPDLSEIKAFVETLKRNSINVTHRASAGEDIDAGCGQLRISGF